MIARASAQSKSANRGKAGTFCGADRIVPGEPISAGSLAAANAPLTEAALSVEIVALLSPAALSNVGKGGPAGDAPKTTLACSAPALLYRLSASPLVLRPIPEPLYVPIWRPAGAPAPNHRALKLSMTAVEALSMKITDSPGAILVMPFSATAEPNAFELSSTFQPVMFAAPVPMLVTSSQSAKIGLLPLDQGATSEKTRVAVPELALSAMTTDALPGVQSLGYSYVRTHTKNKYREMLVLNIKSGFDVTGVYKNLGDEQHGIILEKSLE